MILLDITIPGKPVGAARPRTVRKKSGGVVTYIPDNAVRWEERARQMALAAWGMAPLNEPVRVEVVAVHARPGRRNRKKDPDDRLGADKGKPDLDNVVKLAIDALVKAGVMRDDTLVAWIIASKWHTARGELPSVRVRVATMRGE